ncbi:MAG: hypothetical protein V2J62_08615 [candidate division KSB1 bacterium]|jgi:hypothetical protein|nr:hypothetical protein [candidate division KSB1 bacterium]
MKSVLKTAVILVVFVNTVAWAEYPCTKSYFDKAKQCYLKSLDNENCGVRNSTIFLLVQFKQKHPGEHFDKFIEKLNQMSDEDCALQNRLHAYLAAVCLERPTLMDVVNPVNYEDSKVFFDDIYTLISGAQIASR